MPDAVLFFAAGLGTRMAPLTADRPKPLITVAGKTLLDHALGFAVDIPRKVVNVHYKAAMLRAHLAERDIAISDESDLLRETGGGLRHALPLLGEGPVFTMNTDAVWRGPNPFETLAGAWNPDKMDGLLLLVDRARALGHSGKGDFEIAADGRIDWGPGPIYTGAQIMRTDALLQVPEDAFSMHVFWNDMLARRRLYGVVYDGNWCDVGRPESIPVAEAMLIGAP